MHSRDFFRVRKLQVIIKYVYFTQRWENFSPFKAFASPKRLGLQRKDVHYLQYKVPDESVTKSNCKSGAARIYFCMYIISSKQEYAGAARWLLAGGDYGAR